MPFVVCLFQPIGFCGDDSGVLSAMSPLDWPKAVDGGGAVAG